MEDGKNKTDDEEMQHKRLSDGGFGPRPTKIDNALNDFLLTEVDYGIGYH